MVLTIRRPPSQPCLLYCHEHLNRAAKTPARHLPTPSSSSIPTPYELERAQHPSAPPWRTTSLTADRGTAPTPTETTTTTTTTTTTAADRLLVDLARSQTTLHTNGIRTTRTATGLGRVKIRTEHALAEPRDGVQRESRASDEQSAARHDQLGLSVRANFPPGRRDYSRSPARNELSYDDAPPGDGRQARHPRDYYYQESSGWDDEGTHRGDYRDRRDRDGRDWSRSQADDGQLYDDYRASGRPASPSRKLHRSPTDTIILEGLAPDLTSNDVSRRAFVDPLCRPPSLTGPT